MGIDLPHGMRASLGLTQMTNEFPEPEGSDELRLPLTRTAAYQSREKDTDFRGRPGVRSFYMSKMDNTSHKADKETMSASAMSREELDAKISASDARTDAKFAELRGEISTMRAELTGELKSLQSSLQNSLNEFKGAASEMNIRMSHVEETAKLTRSDARSSKWQVIGTLIALFALSVGFLSWGGAQFSAGQSTAEIARSAARAETETVVRKAIEDAIKASRLPAPDQKPQ